MVTCPITFQVPTMPRGEEAVLHPRHSFPTKKCFLFLSGKEFWRRIFLPRQSHCRDHNTITI